MTTRVFLAALFAMSLLWVIKPTPKAKAEKTESYAMPKPLDSSVHKAFDSVKIVKAKSEGLKTEIKDKVEELKYQQTELIEVQRQLDSIQHRFVQR